MNSGQNRRRFPRLVVPEEAHVYDESGRELGLVSQVSGSGMNIEVASRAVAESLESGRQMRITIIEPGSRATNILKVTVRRREGNILGMEFVDEVSDQLP